MVSRMKEDEEEEEEEEEERRGRFITKQVRGLFSWKNDFINGKGTGKSVSGWARFGTCGRWRVRSTGRHHTTCYCYSTTTTTLSTTTTTYLCNSVLRGTTT